MKTYTHHVNIQEQSCVYTCVHAITNCTSLAVCKKLIWHVGTGKRQVHDQHEAEHLASSAMSAQTGERVAQPFTASKYTVDCN